MLLSWRRQAAMLISSGILKDIRINIFIIISREKQRA